MAYLKASNIGVEDRFGASVAISGDTIIAGADLEDRSATGVNGDQSIPGVTPVKALHIDELRNAVTALE